MIIEVNVMTGKARSTQCVQVSHGSSVCYWVPYQVATAFSVLDMISFAAPTFHSLYRTTGVDISHESLLVAAQ